MFRGSSFHTIDTKGRIIIPSRFRELVVENGGEGLILSKIDGMLVAYPYDIWSEIERKILARTDKTDALRRLKRFFIGAASDCPIDKQGRILVPPSLRDYALLEKDIVMVGVLDHFEVWSRERWDVETRKFEDEDMNNEEIRNEIAGIGL